MINNTSKLAISQEGVNHKVALANLPPSDDVIQLIKDVTEKGTATVASNYNLGCININPYFELGAVDYDTYANFDPTGASNRCVTPIAAHNGRYGLQITNAGGTFLGSKEIPALLGFEVRARMTYRWAVFGSDVDPAKTYKVRKYLGVKCFDAADSFIRYCDVIPAPNKQTTFASPVQNGDTTIHINNSATAWFTDGTEDINHKKSFRCFKPDAYGNQVYTDPISGIIYNPWEYSKWSAYYGYLDVTDNGDSTSTVKLRYPWAFGDFSIGDGVMNSYGGGTYQYWIATNSVAHPNPTTDGKWSPWITETSSWQYIDGENLSATTRFRLATAYVKLLMLPNYRLYIDNIKTTPVSGQIEYRTQFSKLALEWRPVNP